MKPARRLAISLIVGALFGAILSTKFPVPATVLSGAAASAFMYAAFVYNERAERRYLARNGHEEQVNET
jgi:uncharacterized membrane protein YoaK (UPF0700 family)